MHADANSDVIRQSDDIFFYRKKHSSILSSEVNAQSISYSK